MSNLRLWKLILRRLSFARDGRSAFVVTVAHQSMGELEVMVWAKANIHTPAWWNGYLVTDIQEAGMLWAVQGVELTQED